MWIIPVLLVVGLPLLIAALEVGSALYMGRVNELLDDAELSNDDISACQASFKLARQAELKTVIYSCTAPLVMLVVLPFVPRAANKLPRLFRKWDNNISINGDSGGVQMPDGSWVDFYDVKDWEAVKDYLQVKYDDPRYGGDAYYAKGHSPRSFWARYVWLGWRNRASQASFDVGVDVIEKPTTKYEADGVTISQAGNLWNLESTKDKIRVHYGWKLFDAPGRVRPVAIGFSLRG